MKPHPANSESPGIPMIAPAPRRGIAVMEVIVVALIVGVLLVIAIPRFTRPTLDVVEGPAASVTAGETGPIAVRVTSWRGAAQRGVPVAFETADGIAVTPEVATTDSNGVARATWFAGPGQGPRTIVAHVQGRETPSVTVSTRAEESAAPATAAPPAAASDSPATAPPTTPADTQQAAPPASSEPAADSGAVPR